MFRLGPDYSPEPWAFACLIVWYRYFCQAGRFSLLSLFVLLTGVALWCLVCLRAPLAIF